MGISSIAVAQAATKRVAFVEYYSNRQPVVSLVKDGDYISCPIGTIRCELNGEINNNRHSQKLRIDAEGNPSVVCEMVSLHQMLISDSQLYPNAGAPHKYGTTYGSDLVANGAIVDASCINDTEEVGNFAVSNGYLASEKSQPGLAHAYICEQGQWKSIGHCLPQLYAQATDIVVPRTSGNVSIRAIVSASNGGRGQDGPAGGQGSRTRANFNVNTNQTLHIMFGPGGGHPSQGGAAGRGAMIFLNNILMIATGGGGGSGKEGGSGGNGGYCTASGCINGNNGWPSSRGEKWVGQGGIAQECSYYTALGYQQTEPKNTGIEPGVCGGGGGGVGTDNGSSRYLYSGGGAGNKSNTKQGACGGGGGGSWKHSSVTSVTGGNYSIGAPSVKICWSGNTSCADPT